MAARDGLYIADAELGNSAIDLRLSLDQFTGHAARQTATLSTYKQPGGLSVDGDANLYVSNTGSFNGDPAAVLSYDPKANAVRWVYPLKGSPLDTHPLAPNDIAVPLDNKIGPDGSLYVAIGQEDGPPGATLAKFSLVGALVDFWQTDNPVLWFDIVGDVAYYISGTIDSFDVPHGSATQIFRYDLAARAELSPWVDLAGDIPDFYALATINFSGSSAWVLYSSAYDFIPNPQFYDHGVAVVSPSSVALVEIEHGASFFTGGFANGAPPSVAAMTRDEQQLWIAAMGATANGRLWIVSSLTSRLAGWALTFSLSDSFGGAAAFGPSLAVPWLRQKQRDDVERVYFPSGTRGGIPTSGQKSQRQGMHGTYW